MDTYRMDMDVRARMLSDEELRKQWALWKPRKGAVCRVPREALKAEMKRRGIRGA